MAARSALLLGAERAIVVDRIPERLALARNGFDLKRSTTAPSTACTRRFGR